MKKIFAIFGNPVSHSKSPLMHNLAFKTLGFDGCYGRYRLEEGERLAEIFRRLNLRGANVTVPHKEAAYRTCDHPDPFARKVKAVNTLVLRGEKLYGYNTDAPGFLKVAESFGKGLEILFLGAGGTAQATAEILREHGHDLTVLNRSSRRLSYFREAGFPAFEWKEFVPSRYDLIVNMTSAGLKDNALPAPEKILRELFSEARAAVDVIYGKKTPFLRMAESAGLPVRDGSDMLLYQGILAFDLFTGGRYTLEEIEAPMRRALLL